MARGRLRAIDAIIEKLTMESAGKTFEELAGERVGRPRWLRILSITGGSSMPVLSLVEGAAMIFKLRPQFGPVFDVEDPFEQPGPAHARRFSVGSGVWTWSLLLVMIANNNFRCRKVVDVGNLFGSVWQVSTRSVHALLP